MKSFPSRALLPIVLAASIPFSASAQSRPRYRVVDLGASVGSHSSWASRINNRGEIAGITDNGFGSVPFLYTTDGHTTELLLPAGAYVQEIWDLNDRGQVLVHAGFSANINGLQISDTTVLADLSTSADVKSLVGRPIALGFALNNVGDIVGADLGPDFRYHPFLFSDGVFTLLDSGLGDAVWTQAVDINDSRSILIWALLSVDPQAVVHTFLLTNGSMTDIGTLADGGGASGQRINNRGHVLGIAQAGTNVHSFLWKEGRMIDLGDSRFFDLNNNDEMVGRAADWSPVIYTGGAEKRLAPLIEGIGRYEAFQINSLNDAGEMVGVAFHHRGTRAILIEPSEAPGQER